MWSSLDDLPANSSLYCGIRLIIKILFNSLKLCLIYGNAFDFHDFFRTSGSGQFRPFSTFRSVILDKSRTG